MLFSKLWLKKQQLSLQVSKPCWKKKNRCRNKKVSLPFSIKKMRLKWVIDLKSHRNRWGNFCISAYWLLTSLFFLISHTYIPKFCPLICAILPSSLCCLTDPCWAVCANSQEIGIWYLTKLSYSFVNTSKFVSLGCWLLIMYDQLITHDVKHPESCFLFFTVFLL